MKSILFITIAALACTVSSIAQNVPSYIPTDGLVGWWPFNGNANDESGNGNNGSVNGATLTADRLGNANSAYNFDGVDDYISGTSNNLNVVSTNKLSITSWINVNQFAAAPAASKLITHTDASNIGQQYALSIGNDGSIYFLAGNGAFENNGPNISPAGQIQNNAWVHVAVVVSIDSVKLYLNGNMIMGKSEDDNFPINPIDVFVFSSITNTTFNKLFNGSIDDIGIWNRALTPQEIIALYTASSNNNETSNTAANVPGAISYQAVARDAQGAPLADTNVQVRFKLIADSLTGSEEYVEIHTLSTNSLGLFTTAFGAGTPVSNTFENINWSAGNKFLNVQVDTGNGLVDMGTQQLLSTPYSLYSAKAGEIKNPGLPVFSDNAAALAGGLVAGDMYRTAAGVLMVVY